MKNNRSKNILRTRWLGEVPYLEAWDFQKKLFETSDNYLLLLEHKPTYTLGRSGSTSNFLVPEDELDAQVHRVNRGGDVTFHGPGQLVGYPVINVKTQRGGGLVDTKAYVCSIEQLIIDTLLDFEIVAKRLEGFPGVWIEQVGQAPSKIAAVGVRLSRGRSMHGFAINVSTDLDRFNKIIPCGIADKTVTSLQAQGCKATMEEVVEVLLSKVGEHLGFSELESADVVWKPSEIDLSPFSKGLGPGEVVKPNKSNEVPVRLKSRLDQAGVGEGLSLDTRKPDWMKVTLKTGSEFLELKSKTKNLDLTTVCEEAGCPNIYECWNEGTATFMLLGERCTRACGFCLVDTRKPESVDNQEPQRVATAISEMDINFAVLTMVARDDLNNGGAEIVAATVEAIHSKCHGVGVEVLISDLAGSLPALKIVCESRPEILNHNIETVARLQRAVRPSAGYLRSLTVLARAKELGMVTKSGIILGMGETVEEVHSTLCDLAAVGVDIVTIGQYLRPTTNHLPISRWWEPSEFEELKVFGKSVGIAHVEASPLTRSSHHAGTIAGSFISSVPEP